MAGFKEIIGHKREIAHLTKAMEAGKVSHAYIFSGAKGTGKLTLADAFAMALQCTGEGERPCGSCHSCQQAASGNHPDIIHLTHEKPNSIGVEDVREQLVGDVQIRPYNGKYKIYIIPEAEKLTVNAAQLSSCAISDTLMREMRSSAIFLGAILARCGRAEISYPGGCEA